LLTGTVVDFVVCCVVDDTTDVGGIAVDNEGGFTVFGILQIVDSVVLTTLRLGLLGSHIFALSSGDIVVLLSELPAGGDDDCCAYIILAEKTVANTNIIVIATTLNMVRLCMVNAAVISFTFLISMK
jgi:hypothetical protein